ncbi:uncharacterized protein MONOS_13694 [Monocercomonoides exilis]|uniref:uncharacterized protein n=1 Tax=Monocercomonoides exilis TaxID=2049356 RepID=UPI00355A065E|nr:hypothetical protein MONOS_13694 [Monocercomonoides exilis]|eukprot:MONOS_13694.1-p1 / transcript=MONOS_13694.1 / gene=MONOS_13694 / organism=Monocercomonoides_exilis_PA203 / gene_product=unspecified product / transcript_product=unspecified product / location=Mono_scaffold00866:4379-5647(+) / protein_length=423 / sequence_SO=supercontig / SO=protein_coding / is_pseudo=false
MSEEIPKNFRCFTDGSYGDFYKNMFESPDQTSFDELDEHIFDEFEPHLYLDEVNEFTKPSKRPSFMIEDIEMKESENIFDSFYSQGIQEHYESEIEPMSTYDFPENEPKDSTFTDGFGCVENPLPPDDLSTWSSSSYHSPCYEKESPKQLEVVIQDSFTNPKEIITPIELPELNRREETKKQVIFVKPTISLAKLHLSERYTKMDIRSITFYNKQEKVSHSFYLGRAKLVLRGPAQQFWLRFKTTGEILDISPVGKLLKIQPNDVIPEESNFYANSANVKPIVETKVPESCIKTCTLDARKHENIYFRIVGFHKSILSNEKTKKGYLEHPQKRYPILLWIESPGQMEFTSNIIREKGGLKSSGAESSFSISDTFAINDAASQPNMILLVIETSIGRFQSAMKQFLACGDRSLQEKCYEVIEC